MNHQETIDAFLALLKEKGHEITSYDEEDLFVDGLRLEVTVEKTWGRHCEYLNTHIDNVPRKFPILSDGTFDKTDVYDHHIKYDIARGVERLAKHREFQENLKFYRELLSSLQAEFGIDASKCIFLASADGVRLKEDVADPVTIRAIFTALAEAGILQKAWTCP